MYEQLCVQQNAGKTYYLLKKAGHRVKYEILSLCPGK